MAQKAKKQIEIQFVGVNDVDVSSVTRSINKVADGAGKATKSFGMMDVAIGSVVGNIVTGIGQAALGAIMDIGAQVWRVSQQFRDAERQMTTSLGVSADEAAKLTEDVKSIWREGFADMPKATDALIETQKQFRDIATVDVPNVTKSLLVLEKTFGTDYKQTANAAATVTKQFGLDAQQALDFVATGFQRGLDSSGDFADTLGEYSNLFAEYGFSAEEMFSLLETGSQGGLLGVDAVADAAKEFGIRMQDGSAATKEALEQLVLYSSLGGDSLNDLNDGIAEYNAEIAASQKALAGWRDMLKESETQSRELETAIADARRELESLANPQLAEGKVFDDQIENLELQAKKIKLAMMDMAPDSAAFTAAEQELKGVNDQIDRLELEKDITLAPLLKDIENAATAGQPPLLNFSQVMSKIGDKQSEIAGLNSELQQTNTDIQIASTQIEHWQTKLTESTSGLEALKARYSELSAPAQALLDGIADGTLSIRDSLPQVIGMLQQVDDKVVQNQIGVALFGTKWEDIGAKGILSIDLLNTSMDDMTGNMQKMTEDSISTSQEMTAAWNKILEALLPLADGFAELLSKNIVPLVQEYAPLLQQWLGENVPQGLSYFQQGLQDMQPVLDALIIALADLLTTNIIPLVQEYGPLLKQWLMDVPQGLNDFQRGVQAIQPVLELLLIVLKATLGVGKFLLDVVDGIIGVLVNLVGVLTGAISPTQAIQNVIRETIEPFQGLLKVIASVGLELGSLITKITGFKPPDWLGAIGGAIPGFARGGYFSGDSPFLVGEQGPEIIQPAGRSGVVIPNNQATGILGGGRTVNAPITINVQGNADDDAIRKMEQAINRSLNRMVVQGAL